MSPNNHLSFSKSYMLSVHEAIKISYSYHLPCQGSRNCQKSDVSNHSFVDMVRSPILPIHIANLSRLSKCTLPITSIPKPLKLSNSQISYPIWQMSILMFAWRVGDNQVELRSDVFLNSYGGWHAITLQWCFHSNKMSIISHSYVSAFWLQSHILRCGLDGTPMFWNGKPAGRDSVAHARESRMQHFVKSSRSESTGRWQAASVRERFVFVRQYIFLLSLS